VVRLHGGRGTRDEALWAEACHDPHARLLAVLAGVRDLPEAVRQSRERDGLRYRVVPFA
jgi:hypothetical protein